MDNQLELLIEDNQIINTTFNCKVFYLMDQDNNIWLKGKDIASALGYVGTAQAVREHVDSDDKNKFEDIKGVIKTITLTEPDAQTIFINESGLYSLILSSKKPEAKAFKKWITSEVIPAIRKTGVFNMMKPESKSIMHNQFYMLDEYNLHTRIIKFIREYLPHFILVPGLGELQSTSESRISSYRKGYRGGQPDILILNKHKSFSGLAIELKTPKGTGALSEKQTDFLKDLENNGYKTVVSDKYEELIMILNEYDKGIQYRCNRSGRYFSSLRLLQNYQRRLLDHDDEAE